MRRSFRRLLEAVARPPAQDRLAGGERLVEAAARGEARRGLEVLGGGAAPGVTSWVTALVDVLLSRTVNVT